MASIIGLEPAGSSVFGITAIEATTLRSGCSIALLFPAGGKGLAYPFQTCVRGIQGSLIPVVFISIVVGYEAPPCRPPGVRRLVGAGALPGYEYPPCLLTCGR